MKKLIFLMLFMFFVSYFLVANNDSLTIVNLQEQVEQLQEKQKGINWRTVLPLSAFIVLIGGLLYGLSRANVKAIEDRMLKQFETRLEEQIIKTINDKKMLVDLTIGNTDTEQRLMQTKRIFRIGEADDSLIKRVLKNVSFNLQNYYTNEEEAKDGYDILLINNANGSQDLNELVGKVNLLPDQIAAFYYNTNQKFFPSKDLEQGKEDKVNFATNASQIYGNLLNTLKYQDKMEKRKIVPS